MLKIGLNGIDMSGKTTVLEKLIEHFKSNSVDIVASPHVREFSNMAPKERLALYEDWKPEDFTQQILLETLLRSNYENKELRAHKVIVNDRGVITQIGFCLAKFVTEYEMDMPKAYETVNKINNIAALPIEDLSIVLELPLNEALKRAEGKEIWYEHYQELIKNTDLAIKYLCTRLNDQIKSTCISSLMPREDVAQKVINAVEGYLKNGK